MLAAFDAYYRPLGRPPGPDRPDTGDRSLVFEPSRHVQGAWRTDEQHMAPVSGLLAHCLQVHAPRPELLLSRISYDILGVIGAAETEVSVRTLRAGRTIELVGAELSVAGRVAVRATGWRLLRGDTTSISTTSINTTGTGSTANTPTGGTVLPEPNRCEPWDARTRWPGGYIESVDIRRAPDDGDGVRAWIGTAVPLVADTEVDPLAGYLGLVDTANGIGARLDPRRWAFPNTDLTVHLVRGPGFEPDADGRRWVGLDVRALLGPDGVGLTSSTLHDRRGALGRAEQILTLRPLG